MTTIIDYGVGNLFSLKSSLAYLGIGCEIVSNEKEIAKWEREKARPKRSYYFAYLVFIITLIYATDEIASQIGTLMKTEIANDLFAKFGQSSVALLDILSILVVPFQALGLLYRPFADRLGRKKFHIFLSALSEST